MALPPSGLRRAERPPGLSRAAGGDARCTARLRLAPEGTARRCRWLRSSRRQRGSRSRPAPSAPSPAALADYLARRALRRSREVLGPRLDPEAVAQRAPAAELDCAGDPALLLREALAAAAELQRACAELEHGAGRRLGDELALCRGRPSAALAPRAARPLDPGRARERCRLGPRRRPCGGSGTDRARQRGERAALRSLGRPAGRPGAAHRGDAAARSERRERRALLRDSRRGSPRSSSAASSASRSSGARCADPHRGRRRGRDRLAASDRGRDGRLRAGSPARRREAAVGQRARGHAPDRGRAARTARVRKDALAGRARAQT